MNAFRHLGRLRQLMPWLAAGGAASLGGTAIVVTRVLSSHGSIAASAEIAPLTLALLRYGIATLGFVPVTLLCSARRHIARRDLWPVIGLGVLYFGLFPLLFTAALAHTTATHGSLVISLVPILTLLLAVLLGRECATVGKVMGMILATGGVMLALAVVVSPNGAEFGASGMSCFYGDILMLLAAASSAGYGVLAKPYLERNGSLPVMSYGMVAGSFALLACQLTFGSPTSFAAIGETGWVMIGYLAIPGCALAFFLLVWAYGKIEASQVAVFLTLNPLVAMLCDSFFLGETLGPSKLSGLCLVVAGITLVARRAPSRTGVSLPSGAAPVRPTALMAERATA